MPLHVLEEGTRCIAIRDCQPAPAVEKTAFQDEALEERIAASDPDMERAPRFRADMPIELRIAADLVEHLLQIRARLMPERAAQAHSRAVGGNDEFFVNGRIVESTTAPIEQAHEPIVAVAAVSNVLAEKKIVPLDGVGDGRVVEADRPKLLEESPAQIFVGIDR